MFNKFDKLMPAGDLRKSFRVREADAPARRPAEPFQRVRYDTELGWVPSAEDLAKAGQEFDRRVEDVCRRLTILEAAAREARVEKCGTVSLPAPLAPGDDYGSLLRALAKMSAAELRRL